MDKFEEFLITQAWLLMIAFAAGIAHGTARGGAIVYLCAVVLRAIWVAL